MADKEKILIPAKIEGTFTQEEHHKIAAKLKAMTDRWDEIEEKTGIRPPEAYDYSFGLIMSRDLIFAALPENRDTLRRKITSEITAVRMK